MTVQYTHNNSGGYDWMESHHWEALEAAGWEIDRVGKTYYWAHREGLTVGEAKAEWAEVTGLDPDAQGCSCCGRPHHFLEVVVEDEDA